MGRSFFSKRYYGISVVVFWAFFLFVLVSIYVIHDIHLNATKSADEINEMDTLPHRVRPTRTSDVQPSTTFDSGVASNGSLDWTTVHNAELQTKSLNPFMIQKTSSLSSSLSSISDQIDTTTKQSNTNIGNNLNNLDSIPSENAPIRIHAVTYASHGGRDDRFCRAVESAIRHDIDLVILGWGVKWIGLSQKLEAAHSYVKALPSSDIILFTDAFDVLFTEKLSNINEKFITLSNKTNSKIIFSAECGCWPHVMEDKNICLIKYPKSPTPYRYLNSGTWIGYAENSEIMLREIIKEAGSDFKNANDQKLVADMYINHKYGIKLDFYSEIFQSMHMTLDPPLSHCNPIDDIILINTGENINTGEKAGEKTEIGVKMTETGEKITNTGKKITETGVKRYKNKLTNSYPSILHFNGGGKLHHIKMDNDMWYQSPQYNTNEIIEKLKSHLITVPTAVNGKMRFDELCGSYTDKALQRKNGILSLG